MISSIYSLFLFALVVVGGMYASLLDLPLIRRLQILGLGTGILIGALGLAYGI